MGSSLDVSNVVGKVYAQALLELGEKHGNLDVLLDELRSIYALVQENKNFRFIFESPQVSREEKIKVVKDIFGDRISRLTFNLIKLLVRKQRELVLNNILEQFIYLRDASEHRVRVDIISAAALPEDLQRSLLSKLEKVTGKTVIIEYKTDPSLLGGMTVRVGDLYLDGSIAGRIERLRKRIAKTVA